MDANSKIFKAIIKNPLIRKTLAKLSHYYFFHIYLAHHIQHETADFQREIISITEDFEQKFAVILAFRGSAKSTLVSLSYVIWSIIGKQNIKFILLISQTQGQARQILANIRREFESNEILRKDFGPFEDPNEDWRSDSLVLPRYGTKIMSASLGETVRGYKHGQYRPQLVVMDDLDDINSIRTKDGRDKTYNFVTSEVMPIGDTDTKYILVGNLLHSDSAVMRFKKEIENGDRDGIIKEYPFWDKDKNPLWPTKFNTKESITKLKKRIGNDKIFRQEYLLEIVSEEDQVIEREWIKRYDKIPPFMGNGYRFTAIGVDLAISDKDSANFTSFVAAHIFGYDENLKIYILPHPVNKRMRFSETEDELKALVESLGGKEKVKIYIESVGYQEAFAQRMEEQGYYSYAVGVNSASKRERLLFTSSMVRSHRVLFSPTGDEELEGQLVNFGVEKYDDLADAFSILIKKIMEEDKQSGNPIIMKSTGFYKIIELDDNGRNNYSHPFIGDWADRDDELIFRKYNMRNPYRVFG